MEYIDLSRIALNMKKDSILKIERLED